jgi:RNA polymerase sigma-70 factor, ECF subfamily
MMSRVSHAEELLGAGISPDLEAALRAARDGDENGFRALYREVQPRLLRYVRTLVGDDADDVTSEAWLHIARDITGFEGDVGAFRAWSATIARHRALDHLRYTKRRPASPTTEFPDLPAPDDTATAALDTIATETALALIARLPREQAEIILLRTIVGLDAKAVATILGKRPGAVRTAAHRALRRLEQLLNDPERPR